MRGEFHAAMHQQGGTAPVTAHCTRSEGVQCLRIGCSTREHKPKYGLHAAARVRNQTGNCIIRGVTRGQPAPHAANPHGHQHDGHLEACRVWPQNTQATEAQHQGTRPVMRYKTHPTHSFSPHMRYKTRPARPKWPNLARFARAWRTFYRCRQQQAEQGELFRAHTHHQTPQGELFRAQDALRGRR